MTYKLTIETESLDELYATVSNLRGKATVELQSSDTPEPAKEKKTRKPKEAVSNDNAEKAESTTDNTGGESAVSYDDVKKVTLELISKKGKPAALELLAEFGAKSAPDLKVEQFPEYIEKAKTVIVRV